MTCRAAEGERRLLELGRGEGAAPEVRKGTSAQYRTFGTTDDGANSRRMRSRCRSTRKPGPLAGGRCWNRSHGARARFPYRTDDGIAVRPAECAGRPSSSTRRRAAHHSPGPPGSLPRTLDEPIPSLGNQSPRKEANHSAQHGRVYPVGSYGFTWIWKELGLRDERRSSDLHRAFGSAPVCGGIQRRARARALRRSEVRIPSRLRRASSLSPLRLASSTASC